MEINTHWVNIEEWSMPGEAEIFNFVHYLCTNEKYFVTFVRNVCEFKTFNFKYSCCGIIHIFKSMPCSVSNLINISYTQLKEVLCFPWTIWTENSNFTRIISKWTGETSRIQKTKYRKKIWP